MSAPCVRAMVGWVLEDVSSTPTLFVSHERHGFSDCCNLMGGRRGAARD